MTRARLVRGAIELLRAEGEAAATTGRIADAAGIKQPSFYGHFADRDACLEAAATQIGEQMLERVGRHRRLLEPGELRDMVRRAFAAAIKAFLAEPALTRLYLRHRADESSALGRAFGALTDRGRDELQRDLRALGVTTSEPEARAYAELVIAGTLGLVEGLLEGRIADREIAIAALTDVTCAALTTALARRSHTP